MAETPYHKTLKELTSAQNQTNENLLKINETGVERLRVF